MAIFNTGTGLANPRLANMSAQKGLDSLVNTRQVGNAAPEMQRLQSAGGTVFIPGDNAPFMLQRGAQSAQVTIGPGGQILPSNQVQQPGGLSVNPTGQPPVAATTSPAPLENNQAQGQFPNTAPDYMGPGPVLTPEAQSNPWGSIMASINTSGSPSINWGGSGGNGVAGNYNAAQINWNGGQGYSSPGNHDELVQNSIDAFSDQGGAYLSNATRRGLEAAGQRGLLNSSIAAGAANRSAIEAMQPYVQQSVDLAKQREGWAFQSGENALDRSLQVAVENGRMSQSMAELLATHTFQGNQAEFDRTLQAALAQGQIDAQTFQLLKTQEFQNQQNAFDRSLQSALQQGRIDADTASQLRQIGHQSMQAALDRTQQQTLQNQQYAFQGEQAAYDRAAREKLQSDAAFQQDWLQSRSFSREFQSQLSMIPLSAAADLTSYISKYAVENPEIYTPEIINGMSNFMAQNMQSILSQYFPNQTSYTSTTQTGTNVPLPGGNFPPVTIAGGG